MKVLTSLPSVFTHSAPSDEHAPRRDRLMAPKKKAAKKRKPAARKAKRKTSKRR
jgi:hypothetical protein